MERVVVVGGILSGLAGLVVLLQFLFGIQALPALFAPSQQVGRQSVLTTTQSSGTNCPNPPAPLYIFPDSEKRILSPSELQSLPSYKLRIARNEIFARHGLKFYSDMKIYFACEPWYRATAENVSGELSPVEHANITNIERAEHR